MQDLIDTDYGRLLLLKIALFTAMVGLAGINRQYLLPRLLVYTRTGPGAHTVTSLVRSTLVEVALGLGVVMIVGMLGIMAPATDMHAHVH
jgi:putative copper resistance protein D